MLLPHLIESKEIMKVLSLKFSLLVDDWQKFSPSKLSPLHCMLYMHVQSICKHTRWPKQGPPFTLTSASFLLCTPVVSNSLLKVNGQPRILAFLGLNLLDSLKVQQLHYFLLTSTL